MDSNFEVINLGTGTGYSVLDVIHSFEKTTKIKLNYAFAPRREGDVLELYTDPKKARELLGWKAELSSKMVWIARLIKGNLNSKVYYTSLNGFDTNNN